MAGGNAVLVGRREELTIVDDVLAALSDGAGGVLEVAGEPGIGKTRLLDEVQARASHRDYLVLAGRAAEFEEELPFGVFVDAIDDYLGALDSERIGTLAGRAAAELAVAFSAFEPLAAGRPPMLTEERYRTHRALRTLLSALAEPQPVVLVLDDLHWADAGSIEMLSHLLTHPPLGPVLVVAAFRPAQVTGRLDSALTTRLRDEGARRIDLVPLARAEAYDLLGSAVSAPQREQIYAQGGGNPFYLQELARGAARPSTEPARSSGTGPRIPDAVRVVLASEVGSLAMSTQVLLQGAAVVGDPFDEDLAAIAADIGADEALVGFDELLQAGIINPTAKSRRFAFRHPIVRSAVYDSGAGPWVMRAHARVADAMAKLGEPASARARHVERSATPGDEAAVAALVEAGDMIASRAPATAAEWYRAALRLLPTSVEAMPQRISLLTAVAIALGSSGNLEDSAEALGEVLDLLPPDEPARASVVAFYAGIEHLLGRHRQARERLLDAYHAQADRSTPEAVSLMIELAAGCVYESAAEDCRDWAERALAASQALGDHPMAATSAALLSLSGHSLGFLADPELSAAQDLAAALDDAQLATRLDLPIYLGWAHVLNERYSEGIAVCERAARVSRATGQGAYLAGTMAVHALGLLLSGRLVEAKALIDGAMEALRLSPNIRLSEVVSLAAVAAIWTGDEEAGLRFGEESVDLARLQEPGIVPGVVGISMAVVLIEAGQFERAKTVLYELCGGPELSGIQRQGRIVVYEILTRADLALGRQEAAARWAAEASAATNGGTLAVEAAYAARARAMVLAAGGEHARAAELAVDSADRAEAAGSPVEAARCRIIAARSLARTGDRDQAVALLESAEEQLTHCGAFAFRDQAEKELRRLGRRVTRRSGPLGPDEGLRALTERERELAALVARGQTNRQIAASAYLSEKTVERHLSHIFAKLGVSGRAGLAAAVAADSGLG